MFTFKTLYKAFALFAVALLFSLSLLGTGLAEPTVAHAGYNGQQIYLRPLDRSITEVTITGFNQDGRYSSVTGYFLPNGEDFYFNNSWWKGDVKVAVYKNHKYIYTLTVNIPAYQNGDWFLISLG